jgi:hypothetical protein
MHSSRPKTMERNCQLKRQQSLSSHIPNQRHRTNPIPPDNGSNETRMNPTPLDQSDALLPPHNPSVVSSILTGRTNPDLPIQLSGGSQFGDQLNLNCNVEGQFGQSNSASCVLSRVAGLLERNVATLTDDPIVPTSKAEEAIYRFRLLWNHFCSFDRRVVPSGVALSMPIDSCSFMSVLLSNWRITRVSVLHMETVKVVWRTHKKSPNFLCAHNATNRQRADRTSFTPS